MIGTLFTLAKQARGALTTILAPGDDDLPTIPPVDADHYYLAEIARDLATGVELLRDVRNLLNHSMATPANGVQTPPGCDCTPSMRALGRHEMWCQYFTSPQHPTT